MADVLPPFPVDDVTLDLLWSALHPDADAERSSLRDVCVLYSQMAGSDVEAVEDEDDALTVMRDPKYHPNDVVTSLVAEVRRLRG